MADFVPDLKQRSFMFNNKNDLSPLNGIFYENQ